VKLKNKEMDAYMRDKIEKERTIYLDASPTSINLILLVMQLMGN